MKNPLLIALSQYFPMDTCAKAQAASAIICREVIKLAPLASPEQFDLEMRELFNS